MTDERWKRVTALYEAAQERAPEERLSFINQAAAGDTDLLQEVTSLLAQDEKSVVIDEHIAAAAGSLLADNRAVQPGNFIGPYRIDSPLGVGGMGEVYRGHDPKLNRDVAIKILPPAFAGDPDRLARFKREAQVLASLNHPNIATIHGFEDSSGVHALVLELVEGPTLADLLSGLPKGSPLPTTPRPTIPVGDALQGVPRALPVDDAIAIARQIADALEAAHEQGIIHRDLKPANIKVREDGTVKVLDFGLAKLTEPVGGALQGGPSLTQSPTITTPAMTAAGIILGTAAYMSPEQAKGKPADKRSDIWAFGCVLYEMLTGKRAFDGEDVSDTLAAVLRGQPEWSALPSSTPTAVRRLLHRCLERDRKHRLSDIADARLEIEEALAPADTEPHGRAAARALMNAPALLAIAIVGLLVAGLAVVVFVWRGKPELASAEPIAFTIEPPDGTSFLPLTSGAEANAAPQVAVSPNGRYVAFIVTRQGHASLWVRTLSNVDARELRGTEDASYPFWSPDSHSIAFFADGKLKKTSLDGGSPAELCDAGQALGGSWNSDNVILFGADPAAGGGPIRRILSTGGVPSAVTNAASGEIHTWPQFLPNGREFLYFKQNLIGPGREYRIASLNSSEVKPIDVAEGAVDFLTGPSLNSVLTYASGHLLYVRQGRLMARPFDLASDHWAGDPVPLANDLSVTGERYAPFAVSATGVLVYGTTPRLESQLVWKDRTGATIGSVGEPGQYTNVSLSPDERQVAVSLTTGTPPSRDVWTIDLRTGVNKRLTFGRSPSSLPVWSPNGHAVAFNSGTPDKYNLSVRDSAGQGPERVLFENHQDSRVGRPIITDWSDDGRHIVYTQANRITGDIWSLQLAVGSGDAPSAVAQPSGKPFPVVQSQANEDSATFAPGSRWIAYQSNSTGQWEIWVEPFPPTGERHQVSHAGGMQPVWRRDGTELFFLAPNGDVMAVPVKLGLSFDAAAPRALFPSGTDPAVGTNRHTYAVTRDGQRFLINVAQRTGPAPLTVVTNWLAAARAR